MAGRSVVGPTALRMMLGGHLRELRERAGVSRTDAGWAIRASESKISRLELGRVSFKERDVVDLLTLYDVTDERERDEALSLMRNANAPGWWYRYNDLLPTWFQSYLGLEAAASLIRTYEVQFVPGLLQTEAYARAVILLGHRSARPEEIERRVNLRVERRRILNRPNPPEFWAVVDEGVLRRPIGGRAVMREQLKALIELTDLPWVRLQVIPFLAGGHAAAGGAFSILRFPEPDIQDVVYVEQLTSALYLDKRVDVDHYAMVMDRLCAQVEPPDRTEATLMTIREEL